VRPEGTGGERGEDVLDPNTGNKRTDDRARSEDAGTSRLAGVSTLESTLVLAKKGKLPGSMKSWSFGGKVASI